MTPHSATSGNIIVLCSWLAHHTLTKLSLPHDANSVVQNKKETKTKPKKKLQKHTQRQLDTTNASSYTTVFSCCLCVHAVAPFAAEPGKPKYLRPQVDSDTAKRC